MNINRLILVSNRLPFRIIEKKEELEFSPSAGGLVSSIKSYIQKTNATTKLTDDNCPLWIGTSDVSEKKINSRLKSGNIFHDDFELAPVFIPASIYDKFYNGFCNGIIWPLFHYFPSYAKISEEGFEEYLAVNMIFCEKILEVYKPGDTIWIHDYHLMLLPALLRKHLPNATIGFFLHIPFPSFELFRHLPSIWRKELLYGLLGADLIGFHTNDYVQHFLKSIRQILGFDNMLRVITTPERIVTVDTFPISVDYHNFNKASNDNETFNERNKLKKSLYNSKLIISVDRLDYAKGLKNRLESFEFFLHKYPDYKKRVTYILLVVPSRDIIAQYKETKMEIEGLVSRINGKHGSIDWTPVIYQYKSLEFNKLVALYLAADVALITPMRDGMNLVAKEFVVSRSDKRGVLILSETAGASSELSEAIHVNPTDRQEIADSIYQALEMPIEEQMDRNEKMQKRLREYDVMRWAEDFISQLLLHKTKQEKLKIKELTSHVEKQIFEKYLSAQNRLILLDYDGTLTPLARLPHLARPSIELKALLGKLSENTKNEIVIISGRPMNVLEEWFKDLPISLVAEHGGFYKNKSTVSIQTVAATSVTWKTVVLPILNLYTERCAGTFVEEKTLSLAWHFRNAEKDLGFLRSRELINALMELTADLDFQIIEGNMVVETRPRGIDKGIAALSLMKHKHYDFILAIGDDKTDEDMFRVIPESGYSIRVGLINSYAKYNVKEQVSVIDLLKNIRNL